MHFLIWQGYISVFTGFAIARFDCVLKMHESAHSPERCAVAGFCCLRKKLVQSDSHYSFFLYTCSLKEEGTCSRAAQQRNCQLTHVEPFNMAELRSNTTRGQWILGSSYHSPFLVNLALDFGGGLPNKSISRIGKLTSMSFSQFTWFNFRYCSVQGQGVVYHLVVRCPLQTLSV